MSENPYQATSGDVQTNQRWSSLLLSGLGAVVIASLISLISCGVGGVIGLIRGERDAYHRQYLREKQLIEPVLKRPEFKEVEIHEYSGGGAYLSGSVDEADDLERLRSELTRVLGEARANDLMRGVSVGEPDDAQANANGD